MKVIAEQCLLQAVGETFVMAERVGLSVRYLVFKALAARN
jgi:hypothetical protein